jgi:hypothetical protein
MNNQTPNKCAKSASAPAQSTGQSNDVWLRDPKTSGSKVAFPPTPNALHLTDLVQEAIGRTLNGYVASKPSWRYEADFEARTLMWLTIRTTEGVYELARKDLVLLPAALSATRSAFEISVRALWLLDPVDPFEREVRWLKHLETEEKYQDKLANRLAAAGQDVTGFRATAKAAREFRLAVTAALPSGYNLIERKFNFEEILKSIGSERLYSHYMTLSQFAHGAHFAGFLHRKGLSAGHGGGEHVRSADWAYPLELCYFSVTSVGTKLVERMGGSMRPFLTDSFDHKVQTALRRLRSEAAKADYWM